MTGRRINAGRVLEALLRGAATPPRRRRRAAPKPLIDVRVGTGSRGLNAALGTLAGIAAAALAKTLAGGGQGAPGRVPSPVPQPAPRGRTQAGSVPDLGWQPPPAEPPPAADADSAEALLLVRAAIAAAKADGALDAAERAHIAGQLDAAGLDADERDFVLRDLDQPLDPAAIAREVRDPMLAAQVYAAAVAAAGEVTPAERAFLDALAARLRLDKIATAAIEARIGGDA